MQASALPSFQADLLIQALCRTLLHSLWQGVILAALAGIIMLGTRQRKAASRYYLLVGALALFTLGAAATFVWEWLALQPTQAQSATMAVEQLRIANTVAAVPSANILTQQIFQYLNAHAQQVVLIWFLFICIKSIRMLTGLYEVRMLRSQQTIIPDARWTTRVQDLARQLRISRPVNLLESTLAKAPMVLGHLKPLILVPAGLLANLTPEAIEAILLHELAHIRRRDYLVNLLQSFVEILFFFNPAVSWICALLKAERENCCDDLVMQYTQSKTVYIQALVSCQEYGHPELAMALPGSRNTLLARVTRMISNHNHSLNVMEKTLLSVCLVGAGLLLLAFPGKAAKRVFTTTITTTTTTTNIERQLTDKDTRSINLALNSSKDTCTLPRLQQSQDEAALPAFVSLNGRLHPLSGGLQTSLGQLGSLHDTTPGSLAPFRITEDTATDAAMLRQQAAAQRARDKQTWKIEEDRIKADKDRESIEEKRKQADRDLIVAEQARVVNERYKARQDDYYAQHQQYQPQAAPKPTVHAQPAPTVKPTVKATVAPSPRPSPVAPTAPKAPVSPTAAPSMPPTPAMPATPAMPIIPGADDKDLSARIVKELIASRYVKNSDNLSFKISREEFIVNNKRMPADVAKAFADKYVPADHWALLYNFETKD